MKIFKLQAENFKKLKAIEIVPDKNIIEITGKCEQGKTTILDAIKAAICGEKYEEPIREGQEKGSVVVDLGDKVVTRTFTKSGGTLKVESKDGAKYPSPQALLDKLVGKIAFNPLEFAKADSKKQVDMLLGVIDLKVDQAKLKQISGVAVEVMPNPLDMLNVAFKTVYDTRTAVNRQVDQLEKTLASMPKVEPTEPVSLAELVAEKDRLQGIIRENQQKWAEVNRSLDYVKQVEHKRDTLCDEISELEKQLAAKHEALKTVDALVEKAIKEYDTAKSDAAKLIDPDLSEITARINAADETNRRANTYKEHTAKEAEHAKVMAEADDLTAKLEAIKNYKTEIVSNTKMPVPGLDFANGGVTFDNKPFSQASSAQKMRVGIGIGMAANPQLRVIMLDGYESLDSDQRKIVEEMAIEHDFQVWTTAVDSSGKVGIYIEDGEIKGAVE